MANPGARAILALSRSNVEGKGKMNFPHLQYFPVSRLLQPEPTEKDVPVAAAVVAKTGAGERAFVLRVLIQFVIVRLLKGLFAPGLQR